MALTILEILNLQPPFLSEDVGSFQEIYVKIAEATAYSKDSIIESIEPLSETLDYLSTGKTGNIKTIINLQADISFDEEEISEISFVLATLRPAISTFISVEGINASSANYLRLVTSLNNFVIDNVLGQPSSSPLSIGGVYQSTLQFFIEVDCEWSDPSGGAPQSWLDLSTIAGFTV